MSAEQNISPQDYELLSAYIDGELTDPERTALEQRLATESFLATELSSLQATVALIQHLQPMQAPRDFTLTPAMVGSPKVIRLQPRANRAPYLSLVASVMLMLFGVIFMLSEINNTPSFTTNQTAPITASEKIEQVEVASAPTPTSLEDGSQANSVLQEPAMTDSTTSDQTDEFRTFDDTTLNMQAPPADETLQGSDMALETFAIEEAESSANDGTGFAAPSAGTLADLETDTGGDVQTELFQTSMSAESTEEMPLGGMTGTSDEQQGFSMITGTNDEDDEDNEGTNAFDTEITTADADSTQSQARMLETPAEAPPSPQATEPITPTVNTPISGVEIGSLLLLGGLLLLGVSLVFIRRNRG